MILKLLARNKTKEDEILKNEARIYHFEGINLVFMKKHFGGQGEMKN